MCGGHLTNFQQNQKWPVAGKYATVCKCFHCFETGYAFLILKFWTGRVQPFTVQIFN